MTTEYAQEFEIDALRQRVKELEVEMDILRERIEWRDDRIELLEERLSKIARVPFEGDVR